ncbi:MAG TPA: DUF2721 domain-containing protein [Rhodocyclaceae bacterium]|uniref:DUF2721 domain-containing protein n=2 Tax=Zoogloea sp. TaxID=49181 RepID=UPI002C25E2DF|nr:DUF2721 domain-containing protein [Zoogloea sp.]HMV18469.1 DUF2721 domain-containing protein [Rhodocyclaceae bacterium]HMV64251.1 DUF2721 domain-containing protein [Rhodocyclaceae bacterium]HMY49498.1 DUF2721 domain-containing protein [Rhodocyclaceae bacterium]HMZ77242.1 DUF2721 domain-containing protein [Rhodocyclaceae bacterium]HNA68983.1 DUF2721 domain-containing protein [Rhodocyclaceae bacterium]
MALVSDLPTVAHAIQQSVAPVFLLTGVGSLLGVLANRLGRIVDRSRALRAAGAEAVARAADEMALLQRRSRLVHAAIRYCTLCALLICVVIAVLFVGVELGSDFSSLVAVLFIGGMASLIAGLVCFLREISVATSRLEDRPPPPPPA